MNKQPMTVLLIEDEIEIREAFKQKIRNMDDMKLIGVTNSSTEGLKLLKTYVPEAVILDMELNFGEGSGVKFIKEFKKITMEIKPLLFITTNTITRKMLDFLHENEADFVFIKEKEDYSIELVIETLLDMRSSLYRKNDRIEFVNPEIDYESRAMEKIDSELDNIGMVRTYKGWKYTRRVIYLLMTIDFENMKGENVFDYVAKEFKKKDGSAISKAIQTAINNVWEDTDIRVLQQFYTQRVHHKRGVPSTTEFTMFYKEKVLKYLEKEI